MLQNPPAVAGDFSYTVLTDVLQVYDSNIFLASDKAADETKLSDFITTISPAMELAYQTERSRTAVTIRQDISRYAEYDELDNVGQSYKGRFGYAINELSSIDLSAGYRLDHSADSELETSGLLLDTTERKRRNLGGEIQYALSEKSGASLSYGFARDDYSNDDPDSEFNTVSLTLTREVDWLPEAYVYGSGGVMFYQTDYSRQNSTSAVLGGGFRLSEEISLNIDAGVRKSQEKYDEWGVQWLRVPPYYRLVTIERSEEEWGQIAHFQIAYQGEATTVNLDFSYDMQPASGRGTLTERTQIGLDVVRRLNEECRVRGFSSYFLNYREGLDQRYNVDETTVNLGIDLTYDFNRYVSLSGQYLHTLSQDDEDGTEADRNRFWVRLALKYPVVE